jgi:hypothetical protein
MIADMYCPSCDIRYKVRLDIASTRESLIKAQICYICGGPSGQYPGELMETTEELAEMEREQLSDDPIDVSNSPLINLINNFNTKTNIDTDAFFKILEEDMQMFEAADNKEITIFELYSKRIQPPFLKEY